MGKRTHQITVRFSPTERAELTRLAGEKPLAQYLRTSGLKRAPRSGWESDRATEDWRSSIIAQIDAIATALDELKRQAPDKGDRLAVIEERLLQIEQKLLEGDSPC